MTTIALIPARGGSKGIPRKNIKLFNSKPLIYWSIKAALNSRFIDRVIVSTEDKEIAEIASSYSAEVPFMRPANFSRDDSSGIDPVIHALEELPNVNNVLLMQPTSPLRKTEHIDQIFKLRSDFNSDSAVSVCLAKKNIAFKINSKNKIIPENNNFKLLPRQKYNDLYNLNGALYLSTRESIMQNKSFFSPSTLGYIMPEDASIDIDTPLDWELAEYIMRKSS